MASHREDVEEEAKTDMTPMIDAVFLLIIFFLCIDFKTLEAKLPAYLPKDKGSQSTDAEPVEQLSLKIVLDDFGQKQPRRRTGPARDPDTGRENPFMVLGHKIHWELGPKPYDDLDRLISDLEKIKSDPSRMVEDKTTGGKKLMPVVIEPDVGTTYGDVAMTVDAVSKAGFKEINFGGGRGRRKE
jgi:biopolymer transport protein ExbD